MGGAQQKGGDVTAVRLFTLYRVHRGKRTEMMTGDMPKVRNRMAQLKRDSKEINRQPVTYVIEPAGAGKTKFKKKGHNPRLGGGDAQVPRLTKWSDR